MAHPFGGEFRIEDHARGTGLHKDLGIGTLMIICRVWIGNKNSRLAQGGELGHSYRSSSADHEIRSRIHLLHSVDERDDFGVHAQLGIRGADLGVVRLAGLVNHS